MKHDACGKHLLPISPQPVYTSKAWLNKKNVTYSFQSNDLVFFSHVCYKFITLYKQPSKLFISRGKKFRSSRPEVLCKKGVPRNFEKFTGKHLCQSVFFDKVAGLRPATLLKKELWHWCFLRILRNF